MYLSFQQNFQNNFPKFGQNYVGQLAPALVDQDLRNVCHYTVDIITLCSSCLPTQVNVVDVGFGGIVRVTSGY